MYTPYTPFWYQTLNEMFKWYKLWEMNTERHPFLISNSEWNIQMVQIVRRWSTDASGADDKTGIEVGIVWDGEIRSNKELNGSSSSSSDLNFLPGQPFWWYLRVLSITPECFNTSLYWTTCKFRSTRTICAYWHVLWIKILSLEIGAELHRKIMPPWEVP